MGYRLHDFWQDHLEKEHGDLGLLIEKLKSSSYSQDAHLIRLAWMILDQLNEDSEDVSKIFSMLCDRDHSPFILTKDGEGIVQQLGELPRGYTIMYRTEVDES